MRANVRLRLEFFAAFALVALCLWAGIALLLHRGKQEAIAAAAEERQNVARSLAEYEESSLRVVDLSLLQMREAWLRSRAGFDAVVARHESYLRKEKVIQVAIVDAAGYIVYSRLPNPTRESFADREYFKVQKESGGDHLHVSEPVMGRVTRTWALQITRPILDAEGRFAGVIVVAVPPPGMEQLYDAIQLGRRGLVALVRGDGQILALTGGVEHAERRSLAGVPGLAPDGPGAGEFTEVGADGVPRHYSYRRLASYPLSVYVSQGEPTVLAPYEEQRNVLLAGGAIGTLLLAALALLGASRAMERRRFLDERERLMLELHDSCIQSIYAIGLGLESCRRLIDKEPRRAGEALADAGANLNLVMQDLRGFITGTPPTPRSDEEFLAELRRAVPEPGGPALSFDIQPDAVRALSPEQALHVQRIAREALSNVVRHANARTARLSLAARDGTIRLDVSDDGGGIGRGADARLGLGLHHIRARARKLGGSARFESPPGGGTRVAVEFPRRP